MLKGVSDRELFELRNNRRIASLLRNAHFKNPITETEYMALPGDEELLAASVEKANPHSTFMALAGAMGATIEIETNG